MTPRRWIFLIVKYGGILSFAALTLVYVSFEAQNIRKAMLRMRLESNCKDPKVDIEACGQFAIQNLYQPTSEEQQRAGYSMLQMMCEQGNPEACRNVAYAGESWMIDTVTYRDWQSVAWKFCKERGGDACIALAYHEYDSYPDEFLAKVTEHCRSGDTSACAAWVHIQRNSQWRKEALNSACEAGLTGACASSLIKPEMVAFGCKRHGDPYVCFLADSMPDLDDWCAKGVVQACRPDVWRPGYDGTGNQRYLQTRTLVDDRETDCANGVAKDCLQDGARLLDQAHKVWRPDPIALEDFNRTFGRACQEGHNRACVEGALAILDQQIGVPADTPLAYQMLNRGCTGRDLQACWFLALQPDVSEEKRRELTRRVCVGTPRGFVNHVGACASLGSSWLSDQKLTPWRMDGAFNHTVMLDTCTKHRERGVCTRHAENLYDSNRYAWPTLPPKHVESWSAAAIGCAKHRVDACNVLVDISQTWPTTPDQSVEQLGESVCAKVPKMCNAFREQMTTWPR